LGTVGKRRSRNTSWRAPNPGDVDDAIRVIDHFGRHVSFLINVGDEKGKILDSAVARTQPRLLLELGTYCGYSALRMARVMPREARLYSVEFNAANAAIARRILAHAGDRHRRDAWRRRRNDPHSEA
jgi:catechol O-methyltransferase